MEHFNLIASALGIAALAGVNLYLTTFVISASLYFNIIQLHQSMESLSVLGHPTILIASGILYLIEFVADKVPWFDSVWDVVHTAIRPLGGALLGVSMLGKIDPVFMVLIGLLCGSTALTAHLTKSASRLLVNTSPEPVSNSAISLLEDGLVLTGLAVTYFTPVFALCLVVLFFSLFCWKGLALFRYCMVSLRFIFFKLTSINQVPKLSSKLPKSLPSQLRNQLNKDLEKDNYLVWAFPIVTGRGRFIPLNHRAHLCYILPSDRLGLLIKKRKTVWLRRQKLVLKEREKLLYDEVQLFERNKEKFGYYLRFAKHEKGLKNSFLADLDDRRKNLSSFAKSS
ncbi:MAG: DUF4126 domain-containing protein [Verrucomicrobiota bacterium]